MADVNVCGRRRLGGERWRELVADWESSGLTQSDFCRRRGVHLKTFGRWKRRYAGVRGVESSASAFVEVVPEVLGGDGRLYRIVLPNGVAVELGSAFDAGQLSSLLSVVRSC
jgi:hypothetical protein